MFNEIDHYAVLTSWCFYLRKTLTPLDLYTVVRNYWKYLIAVQYSILNIFCTLYIFDVKSAFIFLNTFNVWLLGLWLKLVNKRVFFILEMKR